MCTITIVGTISTSMITTVTTHSSSEEPSPSHSTVRSAPSDSPLPVKIACHGARLHCPDSGWRTVNSSIDANGMNRNSNVSVSTIALKMRCLRRRMARSCGGFAAPTVLCAVSGFTAIVRPSFR